jgi:hypothetical protein
VIVWSEAKRAEGEEEVAISIIRAFGAGAPRIFDSDFNICSYVPDCGIRFSDCSVAGLVAMLFALGCALFLIAFFFYARLWRSIWRLVDMCRADDPSRRFSRLWWTPAWRYHKRRFPESDLRKQIVLGFALCWVIMAAALVCWAFQVTSGHWPW